MKKIKKQHIIHLPVIKKQILVFKTQNSILAIIQKAMIMSVKRPWLLLFIVLKMSPFYGR
ncbi:MAG: hypothetical protein C0433_01675 [Cyclobacterium sp.]|nr:hypothetical protein [Cyclobacterium sp.]